MRIILVCIAIAMHAMHLIQTFMLHCNTTCSGLSTAYPQHIVSYTFVLQSAEAIDSVNTCSLKRRPRLG